VAVPVIMPKLEMAQETATVVEWLKREGEPVEKGEPLLTVETDKVTVEVESSASGILAGVRVAPQQVVPVTEIIAYILQPGEELDESVNQRISESASWQTSKSQGQSVTPVAQRLAEAHGVELGAIIGTGPGGRITKADVEATMAATSRLVAELPPGPGKVRATPAARRIARERGLNLAQIAGSGPRGRIQAADVLTFTPAPAVIPAPTAEVVPLRGMRRTIAERMTASYRTAPHITLTVRVDMSGFEEARARLKAKAEATGQPHVSATALIVKAVAWALKRHPWLNSTLRQSSGQGLRQSSGKALRQGSGQGLRQNSGQALRQDSGQALRQDSGQGLRQDSGHGEEGEIHLLPEINVGVAVAVEEGLIVPVVRQADRKGVAEIAAEVNDLAARAREGRLTLADVAGGTFTISNLGPFGIEQFTAIINPPQAAILAVGATQPEAVVAEGNQVIVRPMMRMTLSADHRIVDGAVAARFLADLREALEAPTLLLW
jgi:pyruvate dehydrogenase E2 component (dihydrolipoamide acetyltransferase)